MRDRSSEALPCRKVEFIIQVVLMLWTAPLGCVLLKHVTIRKLLQFNPQDEVRGWPMWPLYSSQLP